MSQVLVETVGGDVWVSRAGDEVEMEALEVEGSVRGHITLTLTPGQAVALSRALVKAAAEALGTAV